MTTPKEPDSISKVHPEPNYTKIKAAIASPNNLISPLNTKRPLLNPLSPINFLDVPENLTTVDPPSNSTVGKPKYPEWSTMKSPKKNNVLDIKPFKRAKSLAEQERENQKKEEPLPSVRPDDMPRTKFYLKKFTNFFKRGTNATTTDKKEETPKKRNSTRSQTTMLGNKVYPEANLNDPQLETVNEDDDKYDIDLFDKEIMMENHNNFENSHAKKQMYETVKQILHIEEEDYIYQNAHDSEEENDENDKRFKLLDPALVYEHELVKLSNAEPFYSLFTQKKNDFEMNEMYSDSFPLLTLRKQILYIKCVISYVCNLIVTSKAFEAVSLLVIVWNTAMMMVDPNSTSQYASTFDQMFLIIYTIEMGFKIVAFGFILVEKSYMRDPWNLLDFTIISTGYIPYVVTNSNSINLSALRSLRVLRPLRSISKIKALKTILVTLFSAMPLILSSVMVNLFFLLIFAIAGLQLFSGLLKRRCFQPETGFLLPQDPSNSSENDPTTVGVLCSDTCPGDYQCGRIISNPNFDVINFDTIFYSFLMIFQSITLEGWTNIMWYVARTVSVYVVIFHIALALIGAFFLVNLTLAVISMKFKEAEAKSTGKQVEEEVDEEEEKIKGPSVIDIRNLKMCEKSHHKRTLRKLGLTNMYGANEEIFKKEKDEIRWDDLFELKERIREERERLEADEEFMKMRDQELEGSSFKKIKKRNNCKYLPKAKVLKRPTTFAHKIMHKTQKLKFVGIQGVNLNKTPERRETTNEKERRKSTMKTMRKATKIVDRSKQNLDPLLVDKADDELVQLIKMNEDDMFLQESSKKALTFKEPKFDQTFISTLLRNPKSSSKQQNNDKERSLLRNASKERDHLIKRINTNQDRDDSSNSKSKLIKQTSVKVKDEEKKVKKRFSRQGTGEISAFQGPETKKKLLKRGSLQVDPINFLESQSKFMESRRKSSIKAENILSKPNLFRQKSTKLVRQASRLSKLSSFSGGEADGSNFASTILNDSDFNIAGFEKAEKKKSLTLIPVEGHKDNSPFTRSSPFNLKIHLQERENNENEAQDIDVGQKENNNDKKDKIEDEDTNNNNNNEDNNNNDEIDIKKNSSIGGFFNKSVKLKNVVAMAMEKNNKSQKQEIEMKVSIDFSQQEGKTANPQEQDFTLKDLKLSQKVQSSDPNTLLTNDNVNANDTKLLKKIKETKVLKKLIPAVAFTQTDPENNIDDTDLDNNQVRNLSEQASTRTFIDSKNNIEHKAQKWSFLKRTLTSFKKNKPEKKKKEELERIKRLAIQKKFNVLHYKLMITGKEYESNSMDDVWASRIEQLKKRKEEQFQKEVRSRSHMPVLYQPKFMNLKKIEKQRKKEERKLLRDIERKRNDSVDFQSLLNQDTLKKILKISINHKRLPLKLHRNLVALLMKQRNALYGDRSSRSRVTSLLSPNSKTNQSNQSMNFSQKAQSVVSKKTKKKKPVCKIVYNTENMLESYKEKLYDKAQIIEQLNEFDEEEVYNDIWLKDFIAGMKKDYHSEIKVNLRWSGEDTINFHNYYYSRELVKNNNEPLSIYRIEKFQTRVNRLIKAISTFSFDKDVWLVGFKGKLKLGQKYLELLTNSKIFEHSMLLAVIFNTIILAMDGLFYDPTTTALFNNFNLGLTMVFTVEMGLKIVADSPKRYLSDKMNIFDGCVVIISQVELWALSGTKGLSAFRTVRIFRTFRVLRVTRLLRSLEFMKVIINVLSRCVASLIYIGCLLMLFNVIYALIGIQIYSGNLNNNGLGIRQNFDDFQSAFEATFQLMTVENWNDILTITMNSNVGASLTCLYLISWIFMGNYVFLNLILAILLDAFAEEWLERSLGHYEDFEDYERKERERKIKELQDKEQEQRIQAMDIEELETELLSKTRKKKDRPLFDGITCQNSIFIFPKTNFLRKYCYIIVHSQLFENFILFLIIVSSIKLVVDTYLPNDNYEINTISDNIDICFNVAFWTECAMKIISFGFIMDEGSYLRDNWNEMDFFIVISSLIDTAVASINLPFIKILRLLRTLRPLRFISHNLNMKIVVTALLESAGPIANVSIVVLLIFVMFSIFGMSMLQDRFGYCYYNYGNGNYYNINITQCDNIPGQNITGTWINKDDNFDDIFRAMLTVFTISSQENWPTAMYDGTDSNTNDIGPTENSIPLIRYFYMVCLFITNIILINLFVGVISMNFIEAQNSSNPYSSVFLTQEQERWLDFQKMIASAKSDFNSFLLPTNKYRRKIYDIINDRRFDIAIMVCIVSNIITMALTYDGSPPAYDTVLENINYFFTAVFILECILKNIGMGVRAYWYSGWNKFDLFVVATSLLDILMSTIGTSLFSFLRVGPQLARVVRVLRVSRLLKLVKSLKGIQKMLETLMIALPALMNVGALLFLAFFVFSVLGVFLFQDITTGMIIDDYNNFSNFTLAMILLFRCSTGESWWSFMFDTYHQVSYAPLFWIPFIVVCSFIMLNLFILVILDEFEKYSKKGDSPSTVFKESIVEFRKNWSALTRSTKGVKMPARLLIDFFKMLEPDIGFGKEARREMVAKEIMKMNITGDENNNVYFNEVLYGALKRTFGDVEWTTEVQNHKKVKVKRKLNPLTHKMITEMELNTKKKIDKMKKDLIRKELRKARRSMTSLSSPSKRTSFKQQGTSVFKDLEMKSSNTLLENNINTTSKSFNTNNKKQYLNPLVTLLFVGMTFKSWLNLMKKVRSGEMKNDDILEESSFDSEDEDYSERTESFIEQDVFNDEEQKEYEIKAKQPKLPKKNILNYGDSGSDDEIEEEEQEESPEKLKPNMLVEDQLGNNGKNKSILRNARMSAFVTLDQQVKNEKKRYSMSNQMKPGGIMKGRKIEQLISEEREVQDSEDSVND